MTGKATEDDEQKGCLLFCRRKESVEKVICPNIFEKVEGKFLPCLTEVGKSEIKRVATLFWPVSCTHFLLFFIPMSATLFLGRLGKTHLAAGGLALAITNVSGISIGFGMAMGLDTLMNQAIGAKNYPRVGVLLQRAILILGMTLLPIFALWVNIRRILIAIKQDPEVAVLTEEFILYYFPALAFNAFYQVLEKFLVCQKLVRPLICSSFLGVAVNCIFSYVFIVAYPLGMKGGAIAIDLAYFSMCVSVLIAIKVRGWHKNVWKGWSWECLEDWEEFMKFSLPTLAMICIEWWSFEAGTLVIGTQGAVQLAAQVITFNLASINFMFSLGFAVAATVQVGSYLGAGKPEMSKLASRITICFTRTIVMVALLISRDYIGFIFTQNKEVVKLTASVIPYTAVFGILDGFQGVGAGIIRGAGIQKLGAIVNLIGYDVIALPLAIVLCIVAKLLIKGMWIGLAVGLLIQSTAFAIIIKKLNWSKQSQKAIKRSTIPVRPGRSNTAIRSQSGKDEADLGIELTEVVDGKEVVSDVKDDQQLKQTKDKMGDKTENKTEHEAVVLTKTMIGKDYLCRRMIVFLLCLSTLLLSIATRVIFP